jgi:hypothetical protein
MLIGRPLCGIPEAESGQASQSTRGGYLQSGRLPDRNNGNEAHNLKRSKYQVSLPNVARSVGQIVGRFSQCRNSKSLENSIN